MNTPRDLGLGIITTLASTTIVIGAILLSLVQAPQFQPRTAEPENTLTGLPGTAQPEATGLPTETSLPGVTPTASSTNTPAPLVLGAPTSCPAPQNWEPYLIQSGDTLADLARRANTTAEAVRSANCLMIDTLLPGTFLYLPRMTNTATPTTPPVSNITVPPCGPPYGWIFYTVKTGDTLFRLSLSYNVSVPQLQFANCLGESTIIRAGELLYVPNVPTITPFVTATSIPTTAIPPTMTFTLVPTGITPVVTVPTATPTSTPTPTDTPTSTDTPTPTDTPTSTNTVTPPTPEVVEGG